MKRSSSTGSLPERWAAMAAHRPALVGLARSHGAGDDAEDVVHAAMTRVVQQPDLDLSDPLPYLKRAVVNLCRDLHKRARHDRAIATGVAQLPRPRDPVDDLCDRHEASAAAEMLGSALPPELVEMCYRLAAREITWQQAADELGTSEPKLRARVRRAYLQVRAAVIEWRES